MRGRSRFKRHRYRADKMRALTRRVEFLEAERRRAETLLADALRVAAGRDVDPCALLEVLASMRGFDLARGAIFDEREAAA